MTKHIYTFIVHTSYMSLKSLDNVLISSNFPSWEWYNVGGMDLYIVSSVIRFLNYNVQVTNDNDISYYNIK